MYPTLINERERAADRLAPPHQDIHGFRRRALRWAGVRRRRPDNEAERQQDQEPRHAPKVRRLPVVVTITFAGICARASATKFRPLQCIGISTSGSSFLISETTCVRYSFG